MKTKIVLIMFYSILGIWQIAFAQEPDSLNIETEIFFIDPTSNTSNLIDTILIQKELDSLKIVYQSYQEVLVVIEQKIDSLENLLENQLSDKVIFYDSTTLYQNPLDFDDEDDDWKEIFGFVFKIESCKPFKDSLYITARIKYLEGADIIFRIYVEAFETFYQKGILKEKKSGSKTEVVYSSVVSNNEIFNLKTSLKKENLGNDAKLIRVKIIMRVANSSTSKYQEYMEKNYDPIRNNWKSKHFITL
ncbi:MAG: hypothetical protein PHR61_03890 [Candidatus Absconditabacteria bacterium]|nr:hypothetical protein [Candidatus Absconditabacteria bacterium]